MHSHGRANAERGQLKPKELAGGNSHTAWRAAHAVEEESQLLHRLPRDFESLKQREFLVQESSQVSSPISHP